MSRFFVGQRVRIVGYEPDSLIGPTVIGQEGVVDELDCNNSLGERGRIGVVVAGNSGYCFSRHHLAPILPDGHRACDDEFKRDLDKLLEGLPA